MKLILFVTLALALTVVPALAGDADSKESTEETKAEETVLVLMKTSMGDIVLELDAEKAPISVANFLAYVDAEGYDGTIFHRVISTFMIQGGGFKPDMTKVNTNAPIKNEWRNGLKNKKGSIAMARLGGKADSATNQFFINVVNNSGLDTPRDGAGYAVFGMVVQGMDVVEEIKGVKTHALPSGYRDVPVTPVVIESIRKIDALPAAEEPSEGSK